MNETPSGKASPTLRAAILSEVGSRKGVMCDCIIVPSGLVVVIPGNGNRFDLAILLRGLKKKKKEKSLKETGRNLSCLTFHGTGLSALDVVLL